MKLKGKLLVNTPLKTNKLKYQVLKKIFDFENCDCIIIKYLNPDFTMLLNNIQVIITERGSSLSHLAIVAREYNKTVIQASEIISKIPKTGKLSINYNGKNVKIKVL